MLFDLSINSGLLAYVSLILWNIIIGKNIGTKLIFFVGKNLFFKTLYQDFRFVYYLPYDWRICINQDACNRRQVFQDNLMHRMTLILIDDFARAKLGDHPKRMDIHIFDLEQNLLLSSSSTYSVKGETRKTAILLFFWA